MLFRSHPTWASHGSGFSLLMDWYTNGSGWGTVGVTRTIRQWNEAWTSATICGGITQMSHSSQEVVWLRGGGTYKIRTSFNNTKKFKQVHTLQTAKLLRQQLVLLTMFGVRLAVLFLLEEMYMPVILMLLNFMIEMIPVTMVILVVLVLVLN